MKGQIILERPLAGNTVVFPAGSCFHDGSRPVKVTVTFTLKPWCWFTKLMDKLTLGAWPFGKSKKVYAIREDRWEGFDQGKVLGPR